MNEIKLKSRDGTYTTLTKESDNSYLVHLDENAPYMRVSETNNIIEFIDPPGGPLIAVNRKVPTTSLVVGKIVHTNKGYVIKTK